MDRKIPQNNDIGVPSNLDSKLRNLSMLCALFCQVLGLNLALFMVPPLMAEEPKFSLEEGVCESTVANSPEENLLKLIEKWIEMERPDEETTSRFVKNMIESGKPINPFSQTNTLRSEQLFKISEMFYAKLSQTHWQSLIDRVQKLLASENQVQSTIDEIDDEESLVTLFQTQFSIPNAGASFRGHPTWITTPRGEIYVFTQRIFSSGRSILYRFDPQTYELQEQSEIKEFNYYHQVQDVYKVEALPFAADEEHVLVKVDYISSSFAHETELFEIDIQSGEARLVKKFKSKNGSEITVKDGDAYFVQVSGKDEFTYEFKKVNIQTGNVELLGVQRVDGYIKLFASVSSDGKIQWYDNYDISKNIVAEFDPKSGQFDLWHLSNGELQNNNAKSTSTFSNEFLGFGKRLVTNLFSFSSPVSFLNLGRGNVIQKLPRSHRLVSVAPKGDRLKVLLAANSTSDFESIFDAPLNYSGIKIIESEEGDLFALVLSDDLEDEFLKKFSVYKLDLQNNDLDLVYSINTKASLKMRDPIQYFRDKDGRHLFYVLDEYGRLKHFELLPSIAHVTEIAKLSTRYSLDNGRDKLSYLHRENNSPLIVIVDYDYNLSIVDLGTEKISQ